jgi:hypothetical protein
MKTIPRSTSGARAIRIIAIGFALVWHAVAWSTLTLAPRRTPVERPAAPRVVYMPLMANGDVTNQLSDARVVWSPVLFSLPSPLGFSKPFPGFNGAPRPINGLTTGPPEPLITDPAPAPGSQLGQTEAYRQRLQEPAALAPPVSGTLVPAPVDPEASCTVTLAQGLSPELVANHPFPLRGEELGKRPWEARAALVFTEEGLPRSVVLQESSGDAARDDLLVRRLYQWRATPGAPARGIVVVRCAGQATALRTAEEAAP